MDLLKQFTCHLNSNKNKLSKITVKNYKADVGKFLKWYETRFNNSLDIDPSSLTSQIVDLYKSAKIQESNLSPRSFKRYLSSLRRFFRFLKTEGIILHDPFEQMKISLENALASHDKWRLQAFRNYLYLYNKSPLTIKNYILDVRHFLTWAEQVTGVNDEWSVSQENIFVKINEVMVNEYKKRLLKQNFSPRTINRKLSSLRKYLKWLAQEGLIQSSELKKKIESPVKFSQDLPKDTPRISKKYSSFPPLRLTQKMIRAADFLFEIILIATLLKLNNAFSYIIWSIKGKPLFKKVPNVSPQLAASFDIWQLPIDSYPKAMYAPLSISTRYFPWHKKVWHHIRHTRPKWYKSYHSYSITDYFHLSFLIISMSILGFAIYQNLNLEEQKEKSVLSSFVSYSPRILPFNGQLTDNSNNPITSTDTPLRFAIYNDEAATGSALLWEEIVSVNPDSEGKFLAFLGNNTAIPQSLFSENKALWLGVAIGESPELTPREPVASVTLASNAKTLQGLPPITSQDADTKNVVLALDSSGNLTIGGNTNPTFQATGGTFKLLGETLLLSTTPGTNTNVVIAPMDLGKIDLQKPIFNSTNNNNIDNAIGAVEIDDSLAVLATSSAQAAFTINQTSTGELISAYKSGTAKFTIDNNGNIISASGVKWQPFSNSTSALNIANASGSTFVTFDTSNSRVGLGTTNPSYNLHVSGANAEIGLSAGTSDNVFVRWLQNTTERGAVFFLNSDSTFHLRSASGLALDTNNSNTPKVYITTSGNVGIGTVTPTLKLDVQDSQAASAAAQIFNTDIGTDADGLIVKLGNTSTTSVANSNHFISFETSGIGIVGSIQGTGIANKGIQYITSGIAGFAEYLKKDENNNIEYGSVLCIDEKGLVLSCDKENINIIGIASESPGFLGGENKGNKSIAVGLVGQVYTRASTINGNIKPGDPLTSSSIPGVAVKAVTGGQIVGKAMEALECTSCEGKILVSISVSWYDPSVYLTSTGDLSTQKTESPKASTIISPIPEIDEIHTNIISPLAGNSFSLTGPFVVQNASGSAIATIDSSGNASFSGTLDAKNLTIDSDATVSGILRAGKIIANEIDGLEEKFSALSHSQNQNDDTPIFTQGLMAFGPTSLSDTSITGQLSIGGLTLQDNSINTFGADLAFQPLRQGGLSIMGGLVYIDTDGNLKTQGDVSIAGKLAVNIISPLPTSDLVINNASGSGVLSVNQTGDIVASGSGTFSKLNFSLVQPVLAVSATDVIASSSAGAAKISPYQTEITVRNALVTDKSLIYITPVGTPSSQTPFLMRQVPEGPALSEGMHQTVRPEAEGSFTVGIASASAANTPFNWLIIN